MAVQVRVVVQARMTSSRLPGKSMMDVGGLPLAVLVLRRLSRTGTKVVLATSTDDSDERLAEAAVRAGFFVVRGPLRDVRERFVLAADGLAGDDILVRATADNPVPDADLVAWLVDRLTASGGHYVGLDQTRVPYGLGLEAFTVAALRAAVGESDDDREREHVTPSLVSAPGALTVGVDMPDTSVARLRCTVDTVTDYRRAALAFATLSAPVDAPWQQVLTRFAAPGAPTQVPTRDTTDLGQSSLVLGAAQLGGAYGVLNTRGELAAAEVVSIFDVAAASGVTHIDTARAYGQSESRIGVARESGAPTPAVVTKVAPADGLLTPAELADHVRRSVHVSALTLGAAPDAVLLHRASDATRAEGAGWQALRRACAELAVRFAGVSVQNPGEIREVLELPGLRYIQLPLNLLDRRWTDKHVVAQLSARPDVVITARSVFLQGLLLSADGTRWPNVSAAYRAAVAKGIERSLNVTACASVTELAVGYVLAQPWVTSVVVGADSAAQLAQTARAVASGGLTVEQARLVGDLVPPGPDELVDPSRWS